MPLKPLVPYLAAVLVLSAGIMWLAARIGDRDASAFAAGLFALQATLVAFKVNRPVWQGDGASNGGDGLAEMTRRNARLFAFVYAWGALAMFAVYMMSGLKWQHGWQYGLGAAFLAGAIFTYVHRLGRADSRLRTPSAIATVSYLNLAHGLAASAGLVFLTSSGKLTAGKTDWAANHVFLAGGFAIVAISVMSAITARQLAKRG